jgi:hypothetical protein
MKGRRRMLVSTRHRFAFIHVYKVAGTSVRTALRPYADGQLLDRIRRWLGHPPRYSPHLTAAEARRQLGPEEFDRAFTFAFVRNLWDWQVSLYSFMLHNANHPQHELVNSFSSFVEYLDWRVNEDLRLQSDFVTDAHGRQLLDFIGRYESLETDFARVCETIGIPAQLPHRNKSQRTDDYRAYYSQTTRALVRDAFAEDIERFNYSF